MRTPCCVCLWTNTTPFALVRSGPLRRRCIVRRRRFCVAARNDPYQKTLLPSSSRLHATSLGLRRSRYPRMQLRQFVMVTFLVLPPHLSLQAQRGELLKLDRRMTIAHVAKSARSRSDQKLSDGSHGQRSLRWTIVLASQRI
jgi:hypothetical protein